LTTETDDGIVVVEVEKREAAMSPLRSFVDDEQMQQMDDRFERRLGEETSTLRVEISGLRTEMREGFATLRADMAHDRFELLKWAFAFWIGQFFATAALITALARR
jgi:hypothetical protein